MWFKNNHSYGCISEAKKYTFSDSWFLTFSNGCVWSWGNADYYDTKFMSFTSVCQFYRKTNRHAHLRLPSLKSKPDTGERKKIIKSFRIFRKTYKRNVKKIKNYDMKTVIFVRCVLLFYFRSWLWYVNLSIPLTHRLGSMVINERICDWNEQCLNAK